MVARVRAGESMRSVGRDFGVGLQTVQWWVNRARGRVLDEVDWSNHPPIPRRIFRTDGQIEDLVLRLRGELKEGSDLGEFGARAIHRELVARNEQAIPSIRTIGRILDRRGALDGRRRIRRPAPPRGWYLPDVARRRAEVDSFDIIEGLGVGGRSRIEVLTVVSLHGGLPGAWPQGIVTSKAAVEAVLRHWRDFGLPRYVQFDNDPIFQGGHHGRDSIGRLMRICLSLGVIPVFAPPRESGFQAAIESFNGRWQAKVWHRFHFDSLEGVQERSRRYIDAVRRRSVERIDAAPSRRPFPSHWEHDIQTHPRGQVVFLRRTSGAGVVSMLGRNFRVDALWPHRLVRADVDLDHEIIRFHALRRKDPSHQPLLAQIPYALPRRRFRGR